jgi:hypothetical protein
MPPKQFFHTPRGPFTLFLIHSFDVATIGALRIWHG